MDQDVAGNEVCKVDDVSTTVGGKHDWLSVTCTFLLYLVAIYGGYATGWLLLTMFKDLT